jgi:excisionase family DNA binding protein
MKQTLVTTPQAAEYLGGLKPNTLEIWRIQGTGPAYKKIGRLVRYSLDDLDAYVTAQSRRSTSQVVT